MNLKRIDLFQLMNAFQDEEFEPKEECFVDENKVKETVLAQVRQKKRKGRTVLVLAAALAACLALAGWTYGERIYQFISGSQVTISGSAGRWDPGRSPCRTAWTRTGIPLLFPWRTDGCGLWPDGQRVDVTRPGG